MPNEADKQEYAYELKCDQCGIVLIRLKDKCAGTEILSHNRLMESHKRNSCKGSNNVT